MNVEALEQLIRVLEEVKAKKPESFDLITWAETMTDDGELFELVEANPETPLIDLVIECGTTACACGFAGMDKWFLNKGFSFDLYSGDMKFSRPVDEKDYYGWAAVHRLFDITDEESSYLFTKFTYVHPSIDSVIERVKDFIKNGCPDYVDYCYSWEDE